MVPCRWIGKHMRTFAGPGQRDDSPSDKYNRSLDIFAYFLQCDTEGVAVQRFWRVCGVAHGSSLATIRRVEAMRDY